MHLPLLTQWWIILWGLLLPLQKNRANNKKNWFPEWPVKGWKCAMLRRGWPGWYISRGSGKEILTWKSKGINYNFAFFLITFSVLNSLLIRTNARTVLFFNHILFTIICYSPVNHANSKLRDPSFNFLLPILSCPLNTGDFLHCNLTA